MNLINTLLIIVFIVLQICFSINFVESVICKPANQFVHIFCPPGTGKTTLAAKIVRDARKSDRVVYSNVPIITSKKFCLDDMGKKDLRHCILIIDEAGSTLSNRKWYQNLNEKQIDFLKKHRHYDVDIYTFSQAYGDIDNKFRELTTRLLMLKKSRLPFFVRAIAIHKKMDLINGQIVEFFEYDKSNSFRFFVVNLWAYFNSWQKDEDLDVEDNEVYLKLDTM